MSCDVLPVNDSFRSRYEYENVDPALQPASMRRHRCPVTSAKHLSSVHAFYHTSGSGTSGCLSERDALYEEFGPLVRRLTRKYGEDPAMREELHGEIYCRFCCLLERFDPQRGVPLRPYLVRQLSASIYIFARQHWTVSGREVYLEREIDGQFPRETADPTPSWDTALIHKQVSTELHQAICSLSKRQRLVVEWRYYEERSFEEIGMLLNVQTSTARSLLRHAHNNLRKRISMK